MQKVEGWYNHTGQTAKKWLCVVAGAMLMLAAQGLLGVFLPH